MCKQSGQLTFRAKCEQVTQFTGTSSHTLLAKDQCEAVTQLSHLQIVNSRMCGRTVTYTQLNSAYYHYSIYISVW